MRTVHKARDNISSEDDDEGEWLSAKDLQAGDLVKTANGSWKQVISIEAETRNETVYNFEVEDNHNYFVGEIGFLVHNNNCEGVKRLVVGGGEIFGTLKPGDVSLNVAKDVGADVIGNIRKAPFANGSFSEILFERLDFRQLSVEAFQESARILKPGGTLTITTGAGADVSEVITDLSTAGFRDIKYTFVNGGWTFTSVR